LMHVTLCCAIVVLHNESRAFVIFTGDPWRLGAMSGAPKTGSVMNGGQIENGFRPVRQ